MSFSLPFIIRKHLTCAAFLFSAFSTVSLAYAKTNLTCQSYDHSPEGALALKMASFMQDKPTIQRLLFKHCIHPKNGSGQGQVPTSFYAPDSEVLNWFSLFDVNVLSLRASTPTKDNILVFRLNLSDVKNQAPLEISPEKARTLKQLYQIDYTHKSPPDFNTPGNRALTNDLIQQAPLEFIESASLDGTTALHAAVQHRNTEAVQLLLKRSPSLAQRKNKNHIDSVLAFLSPTCFKAPPSQQLLSSLLATIDTTQFIQRKRTTSPIPSSYLDSFVANKSTLAPSEYALIRQKVSAQQLADSESYVAKIKSSFHTEFQTLFNSQVATCDR